MSAVRMGAELEDAMGHLGKWYGAASDLARAQNQRSSPGLFTKITHGKSIEQESLDILIYQKKLKEQEKELAHMLNLRFGQNTWQELLQIRRKIKKEREETIYKQMERRKAFVELLFGLVLFAVMAGVMALGMYFLGKSIGRW